MEKKGLQQTEDRILFKSDISRIISVSPLYKLKHKQIYKLTRKMSLIGCGGPTKRGTVS